MNLQRMAALPGVVVAVRAGARALACVCLLALVACSNEPLLFRKVLVDVDPPAIAAHVDREAVRASVQKQLRATRGLRLDEARGDAGVLRVRVESFDVAAPAEGERTPRAVLTLTAELTREDGSMLRAHASSSAAGVRDPGALVDDALRDVLGQLVQTHNADKLTSDELLTWLRPEASTSQKQRAMRILASRREKRAAAAIAALLPGDDRELSQLALSSLTVLADPTSIDAIVQFSNGQPASTRKQCIDAVRATSDRRALPWLFVLSTGHPDADVRARAQAALEAVEGAQPPPSNALASTEKSDAGVSSN